MRPCNLLQPFGVAMKCCVAVAARVEVEFLAYIREALTNVELIF